MKQGPQYTSCVEANNFTTMAEMTGLAVLNALLGGAIAAALLALFTGGLVVGPIVLAAIVSALRVVVDWMVNGKLVCLYRDESHACKCGDGGNQICAVGQIIDTEDVGQDKNPIEDIDNDYAMNVLLAPLSVSECWSARNKIMLDPDGHDYPADKKPFLAATDPSQPQGDLIAEQVPQLKFSPYQRTVVYNPMYNAYKAWTEIVGRDYGWGAGEDKDAYADFLVKNGWGNDTTKFGVPVLHCEFEGSRAHDVLKALDAFSLGGSWCKKNFIFGALCKILQAILAPLALLAAAAAWALADDGDAADALVGGGTIGADDWVVARGRWVYDGGHDGWNEMHATRVVQKVGPQSVPKDPVQFKAYMEHWCDLLAEIPRVVDPGVHPLTPEQQAVDDNQKRPEHQWTVHPVLDGCTPVHDPDRPPDLH